MRSATRASHGSVAGMFVERTENSVVLHGVSWSTYAELDRARGQSSRPRLAYLDGDLELIMPGRDHERWKTILARLLEAYADEMGVALDGYGSTTFRRRSREAGLEADECYYIGDHTESNEEPPHLALEVSASRSGVNKLEIYRRLEVAEVWLWEKAQIHVYRLWGGEYRRRPRSVCLPELDLDDLVRRILGAKPGKQTETVRTFRKSLRKG
jgi:Uma2 family endonuclease